MTAAVPRERRRTKAQLAILRCWTWPRQSDLYHSDRTRYANSGIYLTVHVPVLHHRLDHTVHKVRGDAAFALHKAAEGTSEMNAIGIVGEHSRVQSVMKVRAMNLEMACAVF